MEYLCEKRYGIMESYTEKEQKDYGLSVSGYTPEERLKIATIRYSMASNSYKRYVATTVAVNVSEETVAAVLENQDGLQGADIAQSSRRIYPDSEYFSSIIGYIGKASQEELDAPTMSSMILWERPELSSIWSLRSRAPKAMRRCM